MFILLPVGVDYQTQRLPLVTFSLMGLNVAAYLAGLLYQWRGGETAELWIIEHLMIIPSESHWYTYITSMFIHGGFFHLLGNMIYLFLFGACVEDALGRWKFTLFYLLGGIASVFGHIAATPGHFASEIPLCGASGAITACLAGFLVLFRNLEIEFRYFGFFFLRPFGGEFSVAAWIVISFWFAKDLLFAALTFASEAEGGGVAFAAHVGGFLAGLALIGLHKLTGGQLQPETESATEVWTPNLTQASAAPTAIPAVATGPAIIYLFQAGEQSGPFTEGQVREFLANGTVTPEALYWQEGMSAWATVQDFLTT